MPRPEIFAATLGWAASLRMHGAPVGEVGGIAAGRQAGVVEHELDAGVAGGERGGLGHLVGVDLEVEGEAVFLEQREALLPLGVAEPVGAVGHAVERVLEVVEHEADAADVAVLAVALEHALDLGVGEVGVGDDRLREAARARGVGQALQPGGLRDRVGHRGLEMDRAHELLVPGVGEKVREAVALAERGEVARGVARRPA